METDLFLHYKLTIAYDGTNYFGWQNNCCLPTIEGTLQKVLEKILQHPICLQAASRTDKGVHARGQIVDFTTKKSLDVRRVLYSMNQLLPPDIRILALQEASPCFHPSLDALAKTYLYQIYLGKIIYPHKRFYYWHHPKKLLHPIQEAFPFFLGEHDFSALSTKSYNCADRTIYSLEAKRKGDALSLFIQGGSFLYKMVRALVGTLLAFCTGKLTKSDLSGLLSKKKRAEAGISAPAHGLFLQQVHYQQKELHDLSQ